MAASKQKYSAAEAASIISNWLAESADESESEVEDSDSSEDEQEVILRDEIEAENVFEGEQDTPPVDPPQPVVVGRQPAAKKAKRNTKVVVDQIPEVWNFLDDNYDHHRMHNFRFIPNKIPGVQLDLGEQNSHIEFFFELFSDDVQLERFEKKKHLVGYVDSDRNCVVCSTSEKRRRTNFVCTGCSDKPHPHPKNCFEVYHTLK